MFSKVDCTSQSGLCSGVNGYPHVKIHVRDNVSWTVRDYDGETSTDALELLCNRLASPRFQMLPSAVTLEKQSVAFAIDTRADESELSLFRSAASDFFHVSQHPHSLSFAS